MATTAMSRQGGGGYVQRSGSSGLYEILDLILDKGLVIDVFLRVSLIGIEILTVDARIVIASVDTYLHFAEAVNRLDLTEQGGQGVPELVENITQDGGRSSDSGDDEEQEEESASRSRRSSSGPRSRQRSSASRGRSGR